MPTTRCAHGSRPPTKRVARRHAPPRARRQHGDPRRRVPARRRLASACTRVRTTICGRGSAGSPPVPVVDGHHGAHERPDWTDARPAGSHATSLASQVPPTTSLEGAASRQSRPSHDLRTSSPSSGTLLATGELDLADPGRWADVGSAARRSSTLARTRPGLGGTSRRGAHRRRGDPARGRSDNPNPDVVVRRVGVGRFTEDVRVRTTVPTGSSSAARGTQAVRIGTRHRGPRAGDRDRRRHRRPSAVRRGTRPPLGPLDHRPVGVRCTS
jgi:hypothetical protein